MPTNAAPFAAANAASSSDVTPQILALGRTEVADVAGVADVVCSETAFAAIDIERLPRGILRLTGPSLRARWVDERQVTAYIEGPPSNVDLLISLFAIVPASDPQPTFPPLPPTAAAAVNMPAPLTPATFSPPRTPTPLAPLAALKVSAAATAPPCPTSPRLPPLHPPHHSPRPNLLLNGDFSHRTASWRPMGGCEMLTWHAPCPWGSVIGAPVEPSSLPASHPCTVFERRQMQLHAQWQQQQQQQQKRQQQQQQQQQKWQQEQHNYPAQHDLMSSYDGLPSRHPLMPLLQPASSVPLAGRPTCAYVEVTGRTATWHGPAQDIAAANQSPESSTAWADDSADGVDGEWANAGSVEASGKEWVRCWGSFRLEKPYGRAVLYVQGPPPSVSILLADVRVVPVDWRERVPWLREQADRGVTCAPMPPLHPSHNPSAQPHPFSLLHTPSRFFLYTFSLFDVPSCPPALLLSPCPSPPAPLPCPSPPAPLPCPSPPATTPPLLPPPHSLPPCHHALSPLPTTTLYPYPLTTLPHPPTSLFISSAAKGIPPAPPPLCHRYPLPHILFFPLPPTTPPFPSPPIPPISFARVRFVSASSLPPASQSRVPTCQPIRRAAPSLWAPA
ncbi:unnamed protein product [Closterium sp. Yama58-4]|nr:unnamed protein product [Closterium sp. Yama58-4]